MALGTARRGKPSQVSHRPGPKHANPLNSKRESPVSVSVKEDASSEEPRKLLFSMDYGTKTLSLAYRIAKVDEEPSPNNVFDVHFSEKEYFAPQIAAWSADKDKTFYGGYGIDRALKKRLIMREDTIELWKLLLYKDHRTSSIAEEVKKQLTQHGHTLEELLTIHLKAVVKEAKDHIKSAQTLEYSDEDIDGMQMQLFLSVPQMWKAPGNRIMTKAAKDAEISYVELVYEPQCAAAYYLHNVKDSMPKQLVVGDELLIADIGGGTGDFVSYRLKSDCEDGAKVGLKIAKDAKGALCGSEFVNQHFIIWLKKHPDGFKEMCEALGLTETACIKQASIAFESIKQTFSVRDADPEIITIRGARGATTKTWNIEVSSENMVAFFLPVIEEIIQCIDDQRSYRTKTLIIPGGFGRSEYLLDYLKDHYHKQIKIVPQASPAVGAYQPVSRGALLRYKDIKPRGFSSGESFGIGRVEIYDENIHLDATVIPEEGSGLKGRKNRSRGRTSIVEVDPYDGNLVVYERWLPLTTKGAFKIPGEPMMTETWQLYIIPMDKQVIDVQVYWTEKPINKHDPIYMGSHAGSKIIDGIEPWGLPLVKRLPNLGALGFVPQESEEEGEVFAIYCRLVLECDGANVKVRWQIAYPGTEPYDRDGNERNTVARLAQDEIFELCEGSHNPFPRISLS